MIAFCCYFYFVLNPQPQSCIDVAYCDRCHMKCVLCVCLCVCVFGTRVRCAKMGEPIEMLFVGLTHVGPRNRVLHGDQDRHADARGDKMAMQPFATLLWKLVIIITSLCTLRGAGVPPFRLCSSLVHSLPRPLLFFLLISFSHSLYPFSSVVHPFPFYQNHSTPFPGLEVVGGDRTWV